MKIEINVSEYSEDGICAQVVGAIAEKIYAEIGKTIRQKVAEAIDATIHEKAEAMVAAELIAPRQKQNTWGEPEGKPTTIAEHLVAEFKKHMEQCVNNDGRFADFNRGTPRKDWLIKKFAIEPLQKEIEEIITGIRKESVEKAKQVVADLLASKLSK